MRYSDWTDDRIHRPLSRRLVGRLPVWVMPNHVTLCGFGVGLAAASLIGLGHWALAALALQASMLLDCVDGDLARARGQVSDRGDVLDHVCDDARFVAIAVAIGPHLDSPAVGLLALVVAWLAVSQQHYYNLERNEGPSYFARRRQAVERLDGLAARYFAGKLAMLERLADLLNPHRPVILPPIWPWRFAGVSTLSLVVSVALALDGLDLAAAVVVVLGAPYLVGAVGLERRAAAETRP